MARSPMICRVCGHESGGIVATCPTCGSVLPSTPAEGPDAPTLFPDAVTLVPGSDEHPTGIPFSPHLTAQDSAPTRAPGEFPRPDGNGNGTDGAAELTREAITLTGTAGSRSRDHLSSVTGPLAQGQSFGPRYHIIRLLGIGGMGAVYQAWDAELGVAVAIKVIRPETMKDPRAAADVERRFKRELLLARQVTHKNVVRIHDLGEIDGIKYITMAYIEGVDLSTRLKREGKLPVQTVLPIAREVVSGLIAAHKAGVVHRDLKPANIILSDEGEALIMDFGIARSAGGSAPGLKADARRHAPKLGHMTRVVESTMVGVIVGTVEFMAPEQARGQAVDQRADIYAFGLILYDALAGVYRSLGAESAVAELQGRMENAPPPVRSIAPEIPDALDRVISKCLEPDPAKRYQTTEELAADLGRLDEHGQPIRIKRVVGIPILASVVVLSVGLLGGSWWYAQTLAPPTQHDPVTVVIADFQNDTGDQAFERTLEPALKLALDGAGFITAYDRTQMRNLGVPAISGEFDEPAARRIAVSQGLGVVVSGALRRQGNGYVLSVKAAQAVTGEVIRTAETRASDKTQVLAAATNLATTVRTALGDETSESAQRFAMETLASQSLDVIHEYALAMEALSNGKNEEARQHAQKAADLDPNFGTAYGIMAAASEGLDERQEADKYIKLAVSRLSRVTERERYRIRGLSFLLSGDKQKCVEEYSELLKRYSSDTAAHNNLGICAKHLRKLDTAVEELQQAVKVLPKRALYRVNLALYSSYNSNFLAGEREAREVQKLNATYPASFNALAFALLGQGRVPEAAENYQQLEKLRPSEAAAGLGDLALYEGRLADAARIFEKAAAADLAAKNTDAAAEKFTALAYTELTRSRKGPALKAAESALSGALSTAKAAKIRFLAARIFVEAGEVEKARALAATLASDSQLEPQAYAKIIEGNIALKNGERPKAIASLTEATKLLDTWIGRFDLGRAYLDAGRLLEADAEFDRCVKRRGEAMALFLDEVPTYGFFPPVYYYVGRVREQNGAEFQESYGAYIDIRGKAGEDPLLPEIRKRLGS